MRPMIDNLELQHVQQILTRDRREIVEQKPPGFDGSLLQNLGRNATVVRVDGVALDPDALAFLEELESRFRARTAVPFVADIVTDSQIENVIIDDLKVNEIAGKPQRYAYTLLLREYVEAVKPADGSLIDIDLLDEARQRMGGMVEGLVIGKEFAAQLASFAGDLGDLYERLTAFQEAMEAQL